MQPTTPMPLDQTLLERITAVVGRAGVIAAPADMATYLHEERGLYHGKAKNVIALSKILLEKHGGEVPRTREALEELPGVGRKTANVILGAGFGIPGFAVDTHVTRLTNLLGLVKTKDPVKIESICDRYARDSREGQRAAGYTLGWHTARAAVSWGRAEKRWRV